VGRQPPRDAMVPRVLAEAVGSRGYRMRGSAAPAQQVQARAPQRDTSKCAMATIVIPWATLRSGGGAPSPARPGQPGVDLGSGSPGQAPATACCMADGHDGHAAYPEHGSVGHQPIVLAGTRQTADRTAGTCAETASCAGVRTPEGSTREKKPRRGDDRQGHRGKVNGWCVFRRS
jgi:hypothetical protein